MCSMNTKSQKNLIKGRCKHYGGDNIARLTNGGDSVTKLRNGGDRVREDQKPNRKKSKRIKRKNTYASRRSETLQPLSLASYSDDDSGGNGGSGPTCSASRTFHALLLFSNASYRRKGQFY
ncbi:uncharacterized protein G2W53_017551 [Senna tora]|uniref:Uncharacterized protein n=1 Tax=Senna tora TaxID=362788 RepID=A0A834WKL3_9FABA|nr:uncharacterized protein G2W53_017551 [Senna tora]